MKTCTYCGRENENQAITCQECGTGFGPDSAATAPASEESDETERFEKITVLDNEVQAELMDAVLSDRKIPHIMQSYHDSALDGLFQAGKGWGVILAHESSREEILAALADIRRQSQSSSGASQGNDT
jgi:transcription initiation factor TFIIIB Brf1 subunit/transcription initiation factor TFIIB